MPKEEIQLRLKAAEERNAVSAELRTMQSDTGADTEGLQTTVSLALNFRRQVKRPLLRAKNGVGGELDEKQLAEIADTERDIKEQIHSRLVRTPVPAIEPVHRPLTSTVLLVWCLVQREYCYCTGCKEMEQGARSCHAQSVRQLVLAPAQHRRIECTM